jgi:hypothetical protein
MPNNARFQKIGKIKTLLSISKDKVKLGGRLFP